MIEFSASSLDFDFFESDSILKSGFNGTVLLVEDEAVIALDMADDLERWAYSVVGIGRNMAESLEIAMRTRPMFAVVDVALRAEEDGIMVAAALKSMFGTRIIFLTAQTDPMTRSRILAAEPDGYLFKPYSANALRRMLETFEIA